MALKIDVSIVDLPSALTSARYLVLNSDNDVIEKGTVDVDASGACTINLDDGSDVLENDNVLVMVDDFDGSNFNTTGRAMDWATVAELFKDFTIKLIGNYVQCDNRTGAYGPWDMGDGTIITGEDPLHLYLKNGEYTITNDDFSVDVEITGVTPFNVELDKNLIICTPQSDIVGGWNFGNGETSDAEGVVEYEFYENGTYDVTYANDSRFTETIVMDYFTDMIESINGNIVTFFNPAGTDGMSFDYGDGFTGSELIHEYPQGGRFIAEINGLYGVVNVLDYAMPTVYMDYSKNEINLGLVSFTPTGADTYTVYVDGAEYTVNDGDYVEHDFRNSGPGLYDVVCVGLDSIGNSGTYETKVTVFLENIAPTLTLTVESISSRTITIVAQGSDTYGESLSYQWNMGDGNIVYGQRVADYTYITAGDYTVTCTVTDDRNPSLSETESQEITVTNTASTGENLLLENNSELADGTADPNGLVGGFYYNTFNFVDEGYMQCIHNNQSNIGRVQIEMTSLELSTDTVYQFELSIRNEKDVGEAFMNSLPMGDIQETYVDGVQMDDGKIDVINDGLWHTYKINVLCKNSAGSFRVYGTKNMDIDTISVKELI